MDITKYGPWAAFGFLLGVCVVVWARPQTAPGVGVIITVCIAFSMVLKGLVSWNFNKKK